MDSLKNKTETTEKDTKEVIKQQVSGEKVYFGKLRPGAPLADLADTVAVRGLNESKNANDSDDD